jgi:hypothetical protein
MQARESPGAVTYKVAGGCHCGNIAVRLQLSGAPDTYRPRSCDCDFCRKHCGCYLSDPQGALIIQVRDGSECGRYRQGSGAAECLVCRNCGVMVAALYRGEQKLYATVNARALDAGTTFGAEQPVSPQKLSADEKIRRWQQLWFSDVELIGLAT